MTEISKEHLYIKVVKPLTAMHKIDTSDNPTYLKEGMILVYNGIFIPDEEPDSRYIQFTDIPEHLETEFFKPDEFNRLIKEGAIAFI